MTTTIRKIARYGVRDLVRSRWLLGYAGFFAAATWALLRFSDSETKALLSLVNVVLFVVPLANLVFGAMYLYGAREFVELLLAQPLRRRELFAGLYLGLTVPVSLAATVGIGAPLLCQGVSAATLRTGALLGLIAAVLSAVFTGVATVIASLRSTEPLVQRRQRVRVGPLEQEAAECEGRAHPVRQQLAAEGQQEDENDDSITTELLVAQRPGGRQQVLHDV